MCRAQYFSHKLSFCELLLETKESARRVHLARRAHDLFEEDPSVPEGGRMVREHAVTWETIMRNLRHHEDRLP